MGFFTNLFKKKSDNYQPSYSLVDPNFLNKHLIGDENMPIYRFGSNDAIFKKPSNNKDTESYLDITGLCELYLNNQNDIIHIYDGISNIDTNFFTIKYSLLTNQWSIYDCYNNLTDMLRTPIFCNNVMKLVGNFMRNINNKMVMIHPDEYHKLDYESLDFTFCTGKEDSGLYINDFSAEFLENNKIYLVNGLSKSVTTSSKVVTYYRRNHLKSWIDFADSSLDISVSNYHISFISEEYYSGKFKNIYNQIKNDPTITRIRLTGNKSVSSIYCRIDDLYIDNYLEKYCQKEEETI